VPEAEGRPALARHDPEGDRDYYLERKYPSFGNLSPRDIASRSAKEVCDDGRGVGPGGLGVYLDFADAIQRLGARHRERYGNSSRCTSASPAKIPYKVPMRIYPAVHYTMGGLWVDYNLMSTVPGLFVIGEANFSITAPTAWARARSCRASPTATSSCRTRSATTWRASNPTRRAPTIRSSRRARPKPPTSCAACWPSMASARTASLHREVGKLMWDLCGMARNESGLKKALAEIPAIRDEFWRNVNVRGGNEELNQSLERAGRVAD
jgi:succinate dehydrogenase / fumarate reductase flavoprotein subunit